MRICKYIAADILILFFSVILIMTAAPHAFAEGNSQVRFTVYYQDTGGKSLAEPHTFYDKAGAKTLINHVKIEGYEPVTGKLVKTLSSNEDENVFTFVYRKTEGKTIGDDSAPLASPGAEGTEKETEPEAESKPKAEDKKKSEETEKDTKASETEVKPADTEEETEAAEPETNQENNGTASVMNSSGDTYDVYDLDEKPPVAEPGKPMSIKEERSFSALLLIATLILFIAALALLKYYRKRDKKA